MYNNHSKISVECSEECNLTTYLCTSCIVLILSMALFIYLFTLIYIVYVVTSYIVISAQVPKANCSEKCNALNNMTEALHLVHYSLRP